MDNQHEADLQKAHTLWKMDVMKRVSILWGMMFLTSLVLRLGSAQAAWPCPELPPLPNPPPDAYVQIGTQAYAVSYYDDRPDEYHQDCDRDWQLSEASAASSVAGNQGFAYVNVTGGSGSMHASGQADGGSVLFSGTLQDKVFVHCPDNSGYCDIPFTVTVACDVNGDSCRGGASGNITPIGSGVGFSCLPPPFGSTVNTCSQVVRAPIMDGTTAFRVGSQVGTGNQGIQNATFDYHVSISFGTPESLGLPPGVTVTCASGSCPGDSLQHIDAVALSTAQFIIPGQTGGVDSTVVQSLTLPEGEYTLQVGGSSERYGNFTFEVDANGDFQIDPAFDVANGGFLEVIGGNTLKVHGFPVNIDASKLSVNTFALHPDDGLASQLFDTQPPPQALTLLPLRGQYDSVDGFNGYGYGLQIGNGGDMVADFRWGVDLQGNIVYDPDFDVANGGFLEAVGNTLKVHGHDITIDASALSVTFTLPNAFGLNVLPPLGPVEPLTLLPVRGNYLLQVGSGIDQFATLNWNINSDGKVTFPPEYNGYLSGQGTATLQVHGYPVSINATCLGEGLFSFLNSWSLRSLNLAEVQHLTLVPTRGGYVLRIPGRGDFAFTLLEDGTIDYDASLDGALIGRGTNLLALAGCPLVAPTGVVGWWTGDGTANDLVGEHAGAIQGGATYATGQVGQAFSLDGTDDRVNVPLTAPTGPFTLEAWVQYTGTTWTRGNNWNTIVEFGQDSPWFGVNDGVLHLWPIISGGSMPIGAWTHVAYSWDMLTSRLYMNGVEVAVNGSAPRQSGVGMGIGWNNGDMPWQGLIDEVTVYNRALSASELRAIVDAGIAGKDRNVGVVGPESVSEMVANGGTVTTDAEGDAATATDPVETSVTSPTAGTVSIEETTISGGSSDGFRFLDQQVVITAPTATDLDPLTLVFRVDRSRIPAGMGADAIEIFRNGVLVLPCAGTSGVASPDPCVANRDLLSDGDAEITVLTSAASRWNFGVPSVLPPTRVAIDIKPGTEPNCINHDGQGVIPVAILGSADFDVATIDAATVSLESLAVRVRGKGNKYLAHVENVNGDGYNDLVVQIEDEDGVLTAGSTKARVTGNLLAEAGGTPFEGDDTLCVIP